MPPRRARRRTSCSLEGRDALRGALVSTVIERPILVPADGVQLEADYLAPADRRGLVVFVHGGGSGRQSPRNRLVASVLASEGLGTLLVDLLTPSEAALDAGTGEYRFDIPLLTERLAGVTDWAVRQRHGAVPVGYFGASTGGAVAQRAAAARPLVVEAVVMRGGRSDLAGWDVRRVQCPTLMLVGSEDPEVRALNETSLREMACPKELHVIPGASHLFEEPGTLEEVADRARSWFDRFLSPSTRSRHAVPGRTRGAHHLPTRFHAPPEAAAPQT